MFLRETAPEGCALWCLVRHATQARTLTIDVFTVSQTIPRKVTLATAGATGLSFDVERGGIRVKSGGEFFDHKGHVAEKLQKALGYKTPFKVEWVR